MLKKQVIIDLGTSENNSEEDIATVKECLYEYIPKLLSGEIELIIWNNNKNIKLTSEPFSFNIS